MMKSHWNTQKLQSNTHILLKNISSLSLKNTGTTVVFFRERKLEPEQVFVLEGDGTYCDIDLELIFETGQGQIVLDYRSVKICEL